MRLPRHAATILRRSFCDGFLKAQNVGMSGARARYSPVYSSIHIECVGDALLMDRGNTFSSFDTVSRASLASLRTAMLSAAEDRGYRRSVRPQFDSSAFEVNWSLDPATDFDDDLSVADRVSIAVLRDETLVIQIDFAAGPSPRSETDTWAKGAALMTAWLSQRRGTFVSLITGDMGYRWYWRARFAIPARGRTVADAATIGHEAIAILEAFDGGDPSREALVSILRAGQATALLGLSEGQLLEAKRSFHMPDAKAEHELAKDVSAMANSPCGGVIVFGLATKTTAGTDVISAVHLMVPSGQPRKVLSVLNRRVFPPIEQLDVFLAPSHSSAQPTGSHLLVINVPPQPDELRPFLVVGQELNGKVHGNYLAIFQRHGEDIFASSPASVHAVVSAGLGLLRGRTTSVDARRKNGRRPPARSSQN